MGSQKKVSLFLGLLVCAFSLLIMKEALAKCSEKQGVWGLALISIEAEDGSDTEVDPAVSAWASTYGTLSVTNPVEFYIAFHDPEWDIISDGP